MGIVSGYTLDLYCDNPKIANQFVRYQGDILEPGRDHYYEEFPHSYTDCENGSACRKSAKKDGWIVNYKTGKAICPRCVKGGITLKDAKP